MSTTRSPGVSIHHGSYVLRKNRKKITLSRVSLGEGALKEALQRLPIAEVGTPQTMHELFECYKKSVDGKLLGLALLAPSTQKQYINIIDRYLDPGLGYMHLGTLTAGNVTKYLTYRHEGHIVAPNKKNPKRGVMAAASSMNIGGVRGNRPFRRE